jgi:hypothetical protein
MSEPNQARLQIIETSASVCEMRSPKERFEMRAALNTPSGPSLPYIAIVLSPEDELLSAKSVPSAKAGKNLVAKISAAFATARASWKVK